MTISQLPCTDGERVIGFIEKYCLVPEGKDVGKPIRLAEFQKKFILDIYDNPHGTNTAYLSIARKNGKTALIAGLVLAHVVGPMARLNSQIVSGAMSRDQAGIVFNLAVKMVRLSPKLSELVHIIPSQKKLVGKTRNVEYKALAAEGKTAHGLSPVLAILDEIGQIVGPQDAFIDAITTAQGAHESPLLIAISTQAATDSDLFSIWIDDAKRSDDPHIVCHVYEADKEADIQSVEAWQAANPALGLFRSEADIKKQADRAKRMPTAENTFRNLCLNQRVSTVSPFVSLEVWKSCGDIAEEFCSMPVYAGLDLSSRTDLTALVLVGVDDDGMKHVRPFFWVPEIGLIDRSKRDRAPYDAWARDGQLLTTPGSTVDYGWVVEEMASILAALNIQVVAFDRWRMDVFKKEMDVRGIEFPMVPFGQGYKDMSPALDVLEGDLLNGRIKHGMHPILTMCAANSVVAQDPAGNRKLDKNKASGRIDGMVALAMAVGAAASEEVDLIDLDAFICDPVVL